MTVSKKPDARREQKMVHMARRALKLSDGDYRALLERTTGKRSSKGMTRHELNQVLLQLQKLGWQPQAHPGKPKDFYDPDRHPLYSKLEALLAEAGRPWQYAHAMAKRISHGKSERLEWIGKRDLWAIVAALQKDAVRHGRPTR